jgi:hypothetical protein
VLAAGVIALAPMSAQAMGGSRVSAGKPNPVADPSHNTSPSQRFVQSCSGMGTSAKANRACDKAALPDFNKVRKGEGLGPMTLPGDFATLSVREQLLAISDIERVDRGRRAALGLVGSIDKLAMQGAKQDRDPDFPSPFPGNSGGANWAGAGNSALLDDFYWMYDDGPGSFNEDCHSKGDPGCWGHRHDIIDPYDARVVMGAAVAYQTGFGTSMTEEFIGGDAKDKVTVSPSWHSIAKTFPPMLSISASKTAVSPGAAVTVSGRVTAKVAHIELAKQRVILQRRANSTAGWGKIATARSGPHGVVHVALHPAHTAQYRLVAVSSSGAHRGASKALRISVS